MTGAGLFQPAVPDDSPAVFAVEAGGTSTRVSVRGADGVRTWRTGTVNPAAATAAEARARWAEALSFVARTGGPDCQGWVASASIGTHDPGPAVEPIREAVRAAALRGRVFVSNDVVPLVLAPPLAGDGLALIAGTGSTCVGARPGRAAVRTGGHEYLLSDEGSGYQIGLAALRAAMRAYEGTGPSTTLSEAAGADLPALARELAASPAAKTLVADFAVVALRCWASGDDVTAAIVRAAADDLVALVGATLRSLDRSAGTLLVVGSLCARDGRFAALLIDRLLARWPGLDVLVVPDAQEQCLALAAAPVAGRPDGVLQWVELSPAGCEKG